MIPWTKYLGWLFACGTLVALYVTFLTTEEKFMGIALTNGGATIMLFARHTYNVKRGVESESLNPYRWKELR